MSHGSASAHSHRYSLHLFLKMETSTGLSCLCTHHALWRLWQGLNAWLCALSRGLPRGELSFCLSWLMSANGPTRKRRPPAGGSAVWGEPAAPATSWPGSFCRVGPGNFTPSLSQIPDVILSHHPARAIARRLPPSTEIAGSSRFDPVGPRSTTMTHPLRSMGITPLRRYYEAVRP